MGGQKGRIQFRETESERRERERQQREKKAFLCVFFRARERRR